MTFGARRSLRLLASAACFALALGALGFGARTASGADPELAKYLLKGGRDDLAKKQYDAAAIKLRRALDEDATLIEAHYWLGVVADASADGPGAVKAYRAYLSGLAAKAGSSAPSKDDPTLQKKAQTRIAVLAAGSAELDRLEDAFVNTLLTMAKSNFVKDPAIAAKGLRILLDVRPDHEEAKRLLEKLAGTAPAADPAPRSEPAAKRESPAGAPFRAVKEWTDCIGTKYFAMNPGWTYEGDHLTIDADRGALTKDSDAAPTGPKFAVEFEARILEAKTDRPAAGIAFALADGDFYCLFITTSEVVLLRKRGDSNDSVAIVPLPEPMEGGWHRVGIVVKEKRIEGWVDGVRRIEHEAVERTDLRGRLCTFTQQARCEFRLIRFGALP